MLSIHAARDPGPKKRHPRIGLAIAGGGPVGAMYELGVLRALEEACEGLDLTRMDGYVGVSSGARSKSMKPSTTTGTVAGSAGVVVSE